MACNGLFKVSETIVNNSQITVSISFTNPVTQFFSDAEMISMEHFRLFISTSAMIEIAQIAVGFSLSVPITQVFSHT